MDERALCEEKKLLTFVVEANVDMDLLNRYSSFSMLKRITAYILRLVNKVKSKRAAQIYGSSSFKAENENCYTKYLSTSELRQSENCWIKLIQHSEFSQEISSCLAGDILPNKSKLLSLNPFIDESGILRVGGRIQHSSLPFNQKHPIILPGKHLFTRMLITEEHLKQLHAGPQLLWAILQRKYWILGARDIIRQIIRKCLTCFRFKAQTAQQLMGNLPSHRLEPCRPFLRTGVDYAGPIKLRMAHGRGKKQTKGYIAIIICFVTKAIHIELVSNLTSEAMLAALKRFVSRREICSDIYSDNGTCFVGAARELDELRKLAVSSAYNDNIANYLANIGINWHRIPPQSPHHAGLCEAGVKSCKYHLRRIIGNTSLTIEEMPTTLCQIEACLNSRPLSAISTDPENFNVLTPGHFLIGDSLKAIPEPDVTALKSNLLSCWQYIQRLSQQFWKKWQDEYLAQLQQRQKWTQKEPNLKIGDLVLIKDELNPPQKWRIGRIVEVCPGSDNIVRVIKVKCENGIMKRPIVKICKLPFQS